MAKDVAILHANIAAKNYAILKRSENDAILHDVAVIFLTNF